MLLCTGYQPVPIGQTQGNGCADRAKSVLPPKSTSAYHPRFMCAVIKIAPNRRCHNGIFRPVTLFFCHSMHNFCLPIPAMHGFLLLTSTLQYKHNCRAQDSTPVIRDIMSMLSSSSQSVGTAKKYPPESMDSGGLQEKLQSKYFY